MTASVIFVFPNGDEYSIHGTVELASQSSSQLSSLLALRLQTRVLYGVTQIQVRAPSGPIIIHDDDFPDLPDGTAPSISRYCWKRASIEAAKNHDDEQVNIRRRTTWHVTCRIVSIGSYDHNSHTCTTGTWHATDRIVSIGSSSSRAPPGLLGPNLGPTDRTDWAIISRDDDHGFECG